MKIRYIITCIFASFVGSVSAQYQNFELKNPETDSKTYVGRDYVRLLPGYRCSATDGQNLHAKISKSLSTDEVNTFLSSANPNGNSETITAINTNLAVGEIPISSSVNPKGAKCYNVPIDILAGRQGFQPNISLSYNSQDGNGVVGIGWSISGLPSIDRINKNYFFDGRCDVFSTSSSVSTIDNDGDFALDGIRLIEISRTNKEIIYETSIGNIKVIAKIDYSISGSHSAPTYIYYISFFKVLYPNGNVGIFGSEFRDRVLLSAPLTKLTDINGSSITFSYTNDNVDLNSGRNNETYYIDEINYGQCGDKVNFAKVKFTYEDRLDKIFSLQSSQSCIIKKRLQKIECLSFNNDNAILLKAYELNYLYSQNNTSRLNEIKCSNGSEHLNPLKFYYENNDASTITVSSTTLNLSNFDLESINIVRGKFDLNTHNDALLVYPKKAVYKKSFSSGTYSDYYNLVYPATEEIKVYQNIQSQSSSPVSISAGSGFLDILACNSDGVGKDELVKINSMGIVGDAEKIKFTIYQPNLSISPREIIFDFDYFSDLFYDGSQYWPYESLTPKEFISGNFTGKGNSEILCVPNSTWSTKSHLVDFNINSILDLGFVFRRSDNDLVMPIDIDGDGQTEIIHVTSVQSDIYKYNPTTGLVKIGQWGLKIEDFASYTNTYTITGQNNTIVSELNSKNTNQLFFADLNGDGKIDIVKAPRRVVNHYKYNGVSVKSLKCRVCGTLYGNFPETPQCPRCGDREWSGHSNTYCIYQGVEHHHYNEEAGVYDYNYDTRLVNGSCPIHGRYVDYEYTFYRETHDDWTYIYTDGINEPYIKTTTGAECSGNSKIYIQDINSDNIPELIINGNIYTFNQNNYEFNLEPIINYDFENKIFKDDIFSGEIIGFNINSDKDFTDIMTLSSNGINRVSFSTNQQTENMISLMVNSYGVADKTIYGKLEQGSNYTLDNQALFPYDDYSGMLWVVNENSILYNKQIINNLKYNYAGAILHKQGLGFLGFKLIKIDDLLKNRLTTTEYDPYKLGVLIKQSSDIAEANYEYNFTVASNKKMKLLPTKKNITDKLKSNTTTVTYPLAEYDIYGNAGKEIIEYGNGIKSTIVNEYENRTGSINLIGLLRNREVTNERSGSTSVSGESFEYNGYGQVYFKGFYLMNPDINPISETNYIFDPIYHTLTSETTHSYLTDVDLTTSYTYWDNDKCSLRTITDPLNRVTEYTYDFTKRLLTESKDDYGKITSYGYDDWRRLNKVTRPDGTVSDITLSWNSGDDPKYLLRETTVSTGQPTAYKLTDAFGRVTRSSVAGFATGTEVLSDNEYDSFGRLHTSSAPYKSSETALLNTYNYDKYDRIEKVLAYNGSVTSYNYSGNTVTTNTDGIVSSKTTDATGMLASATDAGGEITYTYRADAQPDKINAAGVETSFEYNDPYNRQTKLIDPSAGTIETQYDDANRKVKQIWNSGKWTTTEFDQYGQVFTKYTPDFTAVYGYEKGKFKNVTYTDNSRAMSKSNTYDELGRLKTKTELVDNKTIEQEYSYNLGKLNSVTYTGSTGSNSVNYKVVYKYNSNGYLNRLEDANENMLRETNSVNAYGQETSVAFGNGLTTLTAYTPNGVLTNINTSNNIQNISYDFNPVNGTLNSRTDNKYGLIESFNYGALYRLEGYGTTANRQSVGYNSNGNIETKTDAGTYTYDLNGKPYTLSKISTPDNSGQKTQLDINYTVMSRPTTISNGAYTAYIDYNDAYERVFEEFKQGTNVLSTKHLLAGGQYEVETKAGVETQRLYLDGSPYSASVIIEKVGSGATQPYYLHRDYLGSITQVSDKFGNLAAEYSYDAWGRMRNVTNWQLYAVGTEPELRFGRGYTGHEHFNKLGVINMNARLYDPVLGRFLAPDPLVGSPDESDGYNRYMYCNNNPLMYTDPSGLSFKSWWKRNIADPFMDALYRTFGNGQTGFEIGYNSSGGFFGNPTYNGASFGPSAYYNTSNRQFSIGNGSGGFHDNTSSVRLDRKFASSVAQAEQFAKVKWYDNLGVYATGAILTAEDIYNNFGHNHTSYPTTRGYMKDFSDYKRISDYSDQALKYKKISSSIKAIGNLGTGLMTIQSINRFIDGDKSIINLTDGAVGILGLGNEFVSRWGGGSTSIGPFVAYYGAFRLLYDFAAVPNINQIQQNILSNKNPLDGVYNPALGYYY